MADHTKRVYYCSVFAFSQNGNGMMSGTVMTGLLSDNTLCSAVVSEEEMGSGDSSI